MSCLGFRSRTFLASASNAGVQFMNSIMFAVGGPLFQDQFKLQSSEVSIILAVVGPVSGILVQPLIGAWSDRFRSRHGRRRPFILAGSLSCAVGMLLVAFSKLIGIACGDDETGTTSPSHTFGIAFAILGFVWMNICANVVQGPSRALIGDMSPPSKQQVAQALVTTSQMVTAIIAPLLGVALFQTADPYQWLFMMGAIVMASCGVVTTVFGVERSTLLLGDVPVTVDGRSMPVLVRGGQSLLGVFSTLRTTPKTLLRVLAAFFLSYCAFSPFLILDTICKFNLVTKRLSLSFNTKVYDGGSDPVAYQNGVTMSLFNSAAFSGVTLLFSLVLPFLVRPPVGVKAVWLLTTVLSSVCYGLFLLVQNVVPAFAINAGVALNFCVFNSVPFALIPVFSGAADTGLYIGLFNSSSFIAQALVNLIASGVLSLAGQNAAWAIALGVPFGFLAALAVVFLPNADAEHQALLSRGVASTAPYLGVDGGSSSSGSEESDLALSSEEAEHSNNDVR